MYSNVSFSVPAPPTYTASTSPPISRSNVGAPVTSTASLNVTVAVTTSPAFKTPALSAPTELKVTFVTVGPVTSMPAVRLVSCVCKDVRLSLTPPSPEDASCSAFTAVPSASNVSRLSTRVPSPSMSKRSVLISPSSAVTASAIRASTWMNRPVAAITFCGSVSSEGAPIRPATDVSPTKLLRASSLAEMEASVWKVAASNSSPSPPFNASISACKTFAR